MVNETANAARFALFSLLHLLLGIGLVAALKDTQVRIEQCKAALSYFSLDWSSLSGPQSISECVRRFLPSDVREAPSLRRFIES